ncbi:hypothetical protein [Streptomyces sp. NPDC002328]|uniref:hypothetical protein n=1 Tax=Streptomyces sp. NPDC002328 TaxID=3364642 RepID=UPI0036893164
MRARGARRFAALSAAGLLLAGGIAAGTAGTASASTASLDRSTQSGHGHCYDGYYWWYGSCHSNRYAGDVYGLSPFFVSPYSPFVGNVFYDNGFGGYGYGYGNGFGGDGFGGNGGDHRYKG